MNFYIQKLFEIAQKPQKIILGLMSGTSLDGLDLALCKFDDSKNDEDNNKVEVLHFKTVSYSDFEKNEIKKVFAKKIVNLEELTILNVYLGRLYSKIILETLQEWRFNASDVDCIASHGQTVFHAPKYLHQQAEMPNATLQIADADHIAYLTGIITFSDFRQKHLAIGGQGAPMALYGDVVLFAKQGENRILLNIGGVANFTFLPSNLHKEAIFATDTGTGNTLIDFYTQYFFAKPYDANGNLARKGFLNTVLLEKLLENSFLAQEMPKTTGQETFNQQFVENCMQETNQYFTATEATDLLCTLTHFTAQSIANAILQVVNKNEKNHIYVSGGGTKNDFLMELLGDYLPDCVIHDFGFLGIDADAKESVLFATLAYQTLTGKSVAVKNLPETCFGKISLP
jgi:anhydro-N-acetylmuramic acid kinase